jgi:plasmid stabilization system protein ParE
VRLSETARRHIDELRAHYLRKGRPEAVLNLTQAVRLARQQIAQGKMRSAPLPYPELKAEGLAWTHAGSYWFAVTTSQPVTVIAVFYERADIPGRF